MFLSCKKPNFHQSLFQSHDLSEIILISMLKIVGLINIFVKTEIHFCYLIFFMNIKLKNSAQECLNY